jgi:hypothetical protein
VNNYDSGFSSDFSDHGEMEVGNGGSIGMKKTESFNSNLE